MRKFLITFTLCVLFCLKVVATTFSEFWVQPTGGNTNSGHTADNTATFSAVSGNWTNSTRIFFKSGLNPVAGGVTNGAWAAIFLTAFPTNAQYDAIVTGADDTADTITLSSTAFMGTNPGNNVGGMSIRVGGAWMGPNTNTMANGGGFPLNFAAGTATNGSTYVARVNFKTNTYSVASTITHAINGPTIFQGYAVTPGDGGRATIDGGATGTSFIVLQISALDCIFSDLIFANNGNSGSATLLSLASPSDRCIFFRVTVHDAWRSGFSIQRPASFLECEAYSCNKNNSAGHGGFLISSVPYQFERNNSHDNTLANGDGFNIGVAGVRLVRCIADSNGRNGIISSTASLYLEQCDLFGNVLTGVDMSAATVGSFVAENCNFFTNGIGISSSGSTLRNGLIVNCAFGTGTKTNTNGSFSGTGSIYEIGSILYPTDLTPWVDPINGDFRISSTATTRAAGRGNFTESQASYSGAVGYPDIGAAQSASTNFLERSYTFSQ